MDTNLMMDDNIEGQMRIAEMLNIPMQEVLDTPPVSEVIDTPIEDALNASLESKISLDMNEPIGPQESTDEPEETGTPSSINIRDLFEKYTNMYDDAVISGGPFDPATLFRDNVRTRHYIETSRKIDIAGDIIGSAMMEVEGSDFRYYDKIVGETAIALAIVRMYTSIDTSDGDELMDAMTLYDMISAMNLIEYLRNSIDDVVRFEHVCEGTINTMEKQYGMEATVSAAISSVKSNVESLIERLSSSIESFTPEHIDEVNKLIGSINNSVEAVANR